MNAMRFFSFTTDAFARNKKRPYEIIGEALHSWETGDSANADKLFATGIAAYRRDEPDGVDFALGRYGAFLLAQDGVDEAESILKQAIELKTDIPAKCQGNRILISQQVRQVSIVPSGFEAFSVDAAF